jgi:hypothetical protein
LLFVNGQRREICSGIHQMNKEKVRVRLYVLKLPRHFVVETVGSNGITLQGRAIETCENTSNLGTVGLG